jgi:DNA-directed RNA polymerase specialized sigma24 family protein
MNDDEREMVLALLRLMADRIVTSPRTRLARINSLDVVSHAFLEFQRRLSDYSQLLAPSRAAELRRLLDAFVRRTAYDLAKKEARHHRTRDHYQIELTDAFIVDPRQRQIETELEEERLKKLMERCSDAQRAVVVELLRTRWNRAQAAANLGFTTSYISHVLKRIREKFKGGAEDTG